MTISEYMNTHDGIIHIGAADGANLFFIGTREEFFRDIENWNEFFRRRAYFRILKVTREIELAERRGDSKRAADFKALRRIKETYLANFTDIRTREVKEVYPRLNGDGTVVIIKGSENGRFWVRSEYEPCVLENIEEMAKKNHIAVEKVAGFDE